MYYSVLLFSLNNVPWRFFQVSTNKSTSSFMKGLIVWDTIFISLFFYKWISILLLCFFSYKQCSINIFGYKSLGTLSGISERPVLRSSYYWVKKKKTHTQLKCSEALPDCSKTVTIYTPISRTGEQFCIHSPF